MFLRIAKKQLFSTYLANQAFQFSSVAKLHHIYEPCKNPHSKWNLIMLHGILGSGRSFKSVVKSPMISSLVNTYMVDLRNHGNSEHKESMTYKEMADDVYNFVRENRLGPDLIVLGHSMGARVAMEMAVTYPEAMKGVVVVDLAPYNYRDDYRFTFPEDLLWKFQKLSQINLKQDIRHIRTEIFEIADSLAEGELFASNLVNIHGQYKWRINLDSILKNYMSQIIKDLDYRGNKTYPGPVKVICGEKSDYVAPDIVHTFHKPFEQFLKQRDLVWIENADHWVHYSQPYLFTAEVSQFLQSVIHPQEPEIIDPFPSSFRDIYLDSS
jgi:Predicted hydrolases or acyltransferases (alpha/beta hydrolase superfamily)